MWVRNRSKFYIEGNTPGREKSYLFSAKIAVRRHVVTRRKKESVRCLLHVEVTEFCLQGFSRKCQSWML